MRLNKYIALHTTHSRRGADVLISEKRVSVNSHPAEPGLQVTETDVVSIDNIDVTPRAGTQLTTIMLNKPSGYVCSREGQGSKTVYELLPVEFERLNSVGRLDKDSSGLLLLTNDGELANQLTHPRYEKIKVYEVKLEKPLQPLHQQMISGHGIVLDDEPSKFQIEKLDESGTNLRITMHEGRNRQIRRTFYALGYEVTALRRIVFGDYKLNDLPEGEIKIITG